MVTVAVLFLRALLLSPLFQIFFYPIPFFCYTAATAAPTHVESACAEATYPTLCVRTLSTYAGPCRTPRELARAAVNVSLSRSIRVSAYLTRIHSVRSDNKRERMAVGDCITQISDSVYKLRQTLKELKRLGVGEFRWHMSNAETWASAAMTDADTCLDGFDEIEKKEKGKVRSVLTRKIRDLSKVTSNALYLINRLDARS